MMIDGVGREDDFPSLDDDDDDGVGREDDFSAVVGKKISPRRIFPHFLKTFTTEILRSFKSYTNTSFSLPYSLRQGQPPCASDSGTCTQQSQDVRG